MKVFNKEIKAVIFDMDGTLIDSTGIWGEIDRQFFAKRGIPQVPAGYAEKIVHMGLEKGAQMTIETYGFSSDTVEGVIKEWQDASIEQYRNIIPLKEYAIEVLEYFKANNIKLALATANDEALYLPCIRRLGIEKYFDIITDVNKAKAGKSSPKIYDLVAEYFNIPKENIMVVEDTIMGIKTSSENGYVAIGIDDKASRCAENEKKTLSYKYIYSLKELME